jgi:SAM-dependent methyltransferase
MEFFDLVNISERFLELVNPTTPEKIIAVGEVLGLNQGSQVIDFGCGYGEALMLWAERFSIRGIGIDIREHACERAHKKLAERGFADRIEIACANAAEFPFETQIFDVATCIGASFIWGDYRSSIDKMKTAIKANGKLLIGEPYWLTGHVPLEYVKAEPGMHSEYELLKITRDEGFDVEYIVRANHDDWDRYEGGNWVGLIHWLKENPDHPERQEVIDHLHRIQDEYLRFGREYQGWAMFVLTSACY